MHSKSIVIANILLAALVIPPTMGCKKRNPETPSASLKAAEEDPVIDQGQCSTSNADDPNDAGTQDALALADGCQPSAANSALECFRAAVRGAEFSVAWAAAGYVGIEAGALVTEVILAHCVARGSRTAGRCIEELTKMMNNQSDRSVAAKQAAKMALQLGEMADNPTPQMNKCIASLAGTLEYYAFYGLSAPTECQLPATRDGIAKYKASTKRAVFQRMCDDKDTKPGPNSQHRYDCDYGCNAIDSRSPGCNKACERWCYWTLGRNGGRNGRVQAACAALKNTLKDDF